MARLISIWIVLLWLIVSTQVLAQSKEVTHNTQFWTSLNGTYRFSRHWGTISDFHYRSTLYFSNPRFYFVRLGANYWIQEKITASLGYGHTWLSPADGGNTWVNENRIYQQFLFSSALGNNTITQRLRNEQRWLQKIENDVRTGELRFINRVRYLLSFNFPVFKKASLPSLVLADEVLLNFGNDVVYNTMDQNRLFIGIKQNLGPGLSFDFGYMNVYQQRSTGYQYDMNHTIRLFFYYNGGRRNLHLHEHHSE